MKSPDEHAQGFLKDRVDTLRYDGHTNDPYEVAGIVASFIPKGSRVLDVGCGTGSVSRIVMNERQVRLIGVEPDEQRAALARFRGIEVIDGYLTEDIYENFGKFDVILFADVLEHVPEPSELLRLAIRGLQKGGAIVISVPNIAHISVRIDLCRGRFNYEPSGIMDATHLRWFTEESLRLLLKSEGLGIERLRRSAGVTLPYYSNRLPWRLMSVKGRNALIRRLAGKWPRLFGCQHIVRATQNIK